MGREGVKWVLKNSRKIVEYRRSNFEMKRDGDGELWTMKKGRQNKHRKG